MKQEMVREIAEKQSCRPEEWRDSGEIAHCLTTAIRILEQAGFVPARCHTGFSPLTNGGKVAHVSWTAEGEALPPDAKLAEEAKFLATIDDARHDMVAVNRSHLIEMYKALSQLTKLGTATIEAWQAMPAAEAELRHEIFRLADFPAMFAGQHLSKEDRDEARAMLSALTEETGR